MKMFFALMFVVSAMVIGGCAKPEATPPAADTKMEESTTPATEPPAEDAAK
jgi:hypothetical protein